MLHADELDTLLREQINLTNRTAEVDSYIENMDICSDCIHAVALKYGQDTIDNVTEEANTVEELIAVPDACMTLAFVRALTLGIVIGRKQAAELESGGGGH